MSYHKYVFRRINKLDNSTFSSVPFDLRRIVWDDEFDSVVITYEDTNAAISRTLHEELT